MVSKKLDKPAYSFSVTAKDRCSRGDFAVNGDHHHVSLAKNFLHTKHFLDSGVELANQDRMIVWRHSDVVHPHLQYGLRRGMRINDVARCDSDGLNLIADATHGANAAATNTSRPSGWTSVAESTIGIHNRVGPCQACSRAFYLASTIG